MEEIYEQRTLVMSEVTSRIIGCAIKVHEVLGPGYEEAYYQRALVIELAAAGLDVKREVEYKVYYGGVLLGVKRIDLLVESCVVELKAKKGLEEIDAAQVVSYLKASGYPVGLLINFGCARVQTKRFVNTRNREVRVTPEPGSASPRPQRLRDSQDHQEQPTCQR